MATLEQLLADLDLSKFASKFHEEDIDLETAKRLSEEDLKELGLSMGARKKLHEALAATSPAAVVATSAKTPAPVKSPLPVARASPASAAAMPKPAAVSPLVRPKPAAATPVAKKAAASRPDAFRWKWNFGGKKWDDNSGCYYHNHLRLHNGVDPKLAIVGARGQDEDHAIAVFDIVSGKKLAALSRFSENRTSVFDCDIFQDVIVTTGDDSDSSNVACFWDVEGFAFKGEYRGVNERGLLSCALTSSASGALTLVANTDANRNEFMTYDVETASRCSRPLHINIGHTQCADSVRRDPANPGCFLACYPGGKMFYVDGRAGAVVRTVTTTECVMTVRLPETTPGKGITAGKNDGTCIFDLGTGRTIVKLNKVIAVSASMNATTAVCGTEDHKFAFFDISGSGTALNGPDFDLSLEYTCYDIDMASSLVVGLFGGDLMSASLPK